MQCVYTPANYAKLINLCELHTAKFISHKFFQIRVHVDSLYNGSTYMSVTNTMQCYFCD